MAETNIDAAIADAHATDPMTRHDAIADGGERLDL